MNLSCGKCRAIRPFSGEPPKCDVCGWVYGDPAKFMDKPFRQNLGKPRQSWEELGRTIGQLFVWGAVILIGLIVAVYWFTPEADQLAEQYHVPKDKIVIEPKPYGCDFNDAPLGNKHCHYEKAVDVTRACPGPECRVTAVFVSWRKVEE
jgi:hypothetical protein